MTIAHPKPERRTSKPQHRVARKRRPRRVRKGGRAALGRLADKLWGQVVRRYGRCESCGGTERLQAAHGFSRRYRGTRWLPINGFCLCSGCHWRFTNDPLGWDNYLRVGWGGSVYKELRDKALGNAKPDLDAIVAALRAEVGR